MYSGDAVALKEQALGSPARIYEYLRNRAEYSPYHGARSNSVNVFLGLRGNDVDLASTLIGMLRSQGIRARYVQGERQSKVEAAPARQGEPVTCSSHAPTPKRSPVLLAMPAKILAR